MNNTLLSIKTDLKTKQDLKNFASELGITTTAFINMLIKQALRDRKIVLTSSLEPTPYLKKIAKQSDKDYEADRNITHTKGTQEALAHLDSLMSK